MKAEIMKIRVENELKNMGLSINEATQLINKFWNQVEYLKTAKQKALYMIA